PRQAIDAILAQEPSAIGVAADTWFLCALADRDPAAAERALFAVGDNACWSEGVITLSHSFGEGLPARMTKMRHERALRLKRLASSRRKSCRRSRTTARRSASSA